MIPENGYSTQSCTHGTYRYISYITVTFVHSSKYSFVMLIEVQPARCAYRSLLTKKMKFSDQ